MAQKDSEADKHADDETPAAEESAAAKPADADAEDGAADDDRDEDEDDDDEPAAKPSPAKAAAAKPATAKPGAAKPGAAKPGAAKPATATATDAPAKGGPRKPVQPVVVHGPESLLDRLQPHIKKIAVGALALFGVIGVWVGWRYMKRRAAGKNTEHVAQMMAITSSHVRSSDSPSLTIDPSAAIAGNQTFTSEKDQAAAAADALAKAGKIADTAGVYRAGLLVDAGKLDEAEALYRAHTTDPGNDGALAREGLGFVLEARAAAAKDPGEQDKLLNEALQAFKDEQPDDAGPRRDYALYHQGRILVLLGKRADAKTALDAALKASTDPELKPQIEGRLAMVEAP